MNTVELCVPSTDEEEHQNSTGYECATNESYADRHTAVWRDAFDLVVSAHTEYEFTEKCLRRLATGHLELD